MSRRVHFRKVILASWDPDALPNKVTNPNPAFFLHILIDAIIDGPSFQAQLY